MDNHWGYRAGGVSEAGFLLPLSMAGLEAVVVEDLEAWEVLAVVCPCAGRQRQSSKWFQGQKYLKEQILADAEDQVVVAPGEGKPVGPWRMEKEVAPPWHQPTPSS